MKILHTSDWHIGRNLNGRKRYDEHEAFLNWLAEKISSDGVDALLIAGDVFDNSTPSNKAQELYYRFLGKVAKTPCRHIVVTAGNHDSPSFLDAPKEILRFMDVHVIGAVSDNLEDEVLALKNSAGEVELIVCAIPYLRDRDIRTAEAGESIEDKDRKLVEGICNHYKTVYDIAKHTRDELGEKVPIVAMGHLFTVGGQTSDGVRELYVGSLAHVGADIFPEYIVDYLALGHLHVPQAVGKPGSLIRYSGSPVPLGFGEARHKKSVSLVEFSSTTTPVVTQITIPRFQELARIRGDWDKISDRVNKLKSLESNTWLEIVYEGDEVIGNLRERLDGIIEGTRLEVLKIENKQLLKSVTTRIHDTETLEDLNTYDVFIRCLDAQNVTEDQRVELIRTYKEAVNSLHDDDSNAE